MSNSDYSFNSSYNSNFYLDSESNSNIELKSILYSDIVSDINSKSIVKINNNYKIYNKYKKILINKWNNKI